jgi:hypothetical protein
MVRRTRRWTLRIGREVSPRIAESKERRSIERRPVAVRHAVPSPVRLEHDELGRKEATMTDSIYRVTEVIGTSTESWEDAARNAVEVAARSLRDLRVGEIVRLDVTIEDGRVTHYRARVNISFKYEMEHAGT